MRKADGCLLMGLETSIEKLEHLSIAGLREASCLALVLLSYCLFPGSTAPHLMCSELLHSRCQKVGLWPPAESLFLMGPPSGESTGLKALLCLALVGGCRECRAPGGSWMPWEEDEEGDQRAGSPNQQRPSVAPQSPGCVGCRWLGLAAWLAPVATVPRGCRQQLGDLL